MKTIKAVFCALLALVMMASNALAGREIERKRRNSSDEMVFSSEERYRASYYLSNWGEQCLSGRGWWLESYRNGTVTTEMIDSLIIYVYINQSDKISYSLDEGSIRCKDLAELAERHFGVSPDLSGSMSYLSDDLFYISGNSVCFDRNLAEETQNNYFTIVTSARADGSNYRVRFRIYRASLSYWRSTGYWFDRSVYRQTGAQADDDPDFTCVAEGSAVLEPYRASSTSTYRIRSYSVDRDDL